jgi:hypothetical protein
MSRISYETPVGTFKVWQDAADACERCDLNATLNIVVHDDTNEGETDPSRCMTSDEFDARVAQIEARNSRN